MGVCHIIKKGILILPILFFPVAVFGQASISVGISDPVYRAIDRLVAAGVVDVVIMGQRPFARSEVARILIEAEKNIEKPKNPRTKMMVCRLLKYWRGKYSEETGDNPRGCLGQTKATPGVVSGSHEWSLHPFDRLDINPILLDAVDRAEFNNGMGTVAAHTRPLTEYRGGRHIANAYNNAFETYHWIRGPYFVIFAHPRFQTQINSSSMREEENKIFVQELYGKFGYSNFELEVGRDEVVWGQGEFGGLIFSDNARPLDMVRITNPHPFQLPWVFNRLGSFKGTILLANMGPDYIHKYTYLSAWKMSFQPAHFVELGLYYGFLMGGDNGPSVTSGDVGRTFFGFIPKVSRLGKASLRGGFDLLFRIEQLWNAELYTELYLEDASTSHPKAMFKDKAAYHGGVYLPRLGNSNNMALRLSYTHTGTSIYRNREWTSGFALSNEFLGSPLGPDADGFYLSYYYDLGFVSRLIARIAYEGRSGDTYNEKPDGGSSVATYGSTERRYRGTVTLQTQVNKIVRASFHFGYESVDNFNFSKNNGRRSVIGGIQLQFDLNI